MKKYNLIVIGGGGGTKLRPLADAGWKMAIIEKEALGGTCLNRGCIPSKMLIQAVEVMDEIREARKFGISDSSGANFAPVLDFEKLTTETTKTITGYSEGIAKAYEKHERLDYYHGEAKFVEDKVIEVNGEKLTAEKILIATGSRASIPAISGLAGTPFWTNRQALRPDRRPKKMIVVGGGYIAVELGYFYAATGTEVEFLVRSKMVKSEDSEIRKEFEKVFGEKYTVRFGATPVKVSYENEKFKVEIKDEDSGKSITGDSKILEADTLLMATGIRPNSDNLGLENTAVKVDSRGYIEVDEYLQTSVPGVYAMGDVIGRYFFRHTVNFEGEYLLEQWKQEKMVRKPEPIDYPPVPHAIFTNPEIAGVGVTEDELIARGWQNGEEYIVGKSDYKNSAKGGDAMKSDHGFCKLIFARIDKNLESEKLETSNEVKTSEKTKPQNLKLVGAHILGAQASNMIHTLIAFLNMNATLHDLLRMIYIHPALPEIVRNAARDARGKC